MTDTKTADELAIRNIIATLAFCADNPRVEDLPEYMACWTEDGIWDMAGNVSKGHDEILSGATERRRAAAAAGGGAQGRHFVSMTRVRVDGDAATSNSYFQFVNSSVNPPVLQLVGHYTDTFRRTSDGWKIAHRVITFG